MIDTTINAGHIWTIGIGCLAAVAFGVLWYAQTQALAKDQLRQDGSIEGNAASASKNYEAINDHNVRLRGIRGDVNTNRRNIEGFKETQNETNRLLRNLTGEIQRGRSAC